VSIGTALTDILKTEFPAYSHETPSEIETLIAKKLVKALYTILTDYAAEEDMELYGTYTYISRSPRIESLFY